MIMRKGKRETMARIELPNQESIKTLGENKITSIWGILRANTIKERRNKDKIVPQKNKKTPQNQALQQGINSEMDQRTRKLIINKTLQPRDEWHRQEKKERKKLPALRIV